MNRKRREVKIDSNKFFCWNEQCDAYQKKGEGNVIFSHFDGKDKDIMYLKCKLCNKKFSENKGTIFFNKKTKSDTIVKVLKSTSEGTGIRATARIFDLDKNTVLSLVRDAGKHSKEFENLFF